jgi:hypothetical protein
MDTETIEQLVDAYVNAAGAKQLGQRYGMARSMVLLLVRAAGVAVRHPASAHTRPPKSKSCTGLDELR